MKKFPLWKTSQKIVSHYTIKEAVLKCLPHTINWDETKFLGAWFMCYYNSLSSYDKIAKALKIGNSNQSVRCMRGVRKIDNLLRVGDIETLQNFRTIEMLIEGTETSGEKIYINYIKSGKSIFTYLTEEYKYE